MIKIFALTLLLIADRSYASIQLFTGVHKSLLDVQDKNGDELKTPFEPTFALGTNFKLAESWGFSPHIGYIHNTISSDDSYGKYRKHTIFILYDFIWLPLSGMKDLGLRFGIGNFITRTKGEGGTVQIPNGGGTATAYRPGKETRSSYSGTFNFGVDYMFNWSSGWFNNFALRFETIVYRPLAGEHRNYAYQLGSVFFF
jgi:hypothetical protein